MLLEPWRFERQSMIIQFWNWYNETKPVYHNVCVQRDSCLINVTYIVIIIKLYLIMNFSPCGMFETGRYYHHGLWLIAYVRCSQEGTISWVMSRICLIHVRWLSITRFAFNNVLWLCSSINSFRYIKDTVYSVLD